MDEQQTGVVKRSLKVKFTLLIVILVLIVLAGNWLSFQQSKRILLKEIESRGAYIASNLAYSVSRGILTKDDELLDGVLEKTALDEDVLYVVVVNQNEKILFSKNAYPQQTTSLPGTIRHVSCKSEKPVVQSHIMDGQQVYDVGVGIIQEDSGCLGTVHIGMSLKNLDKKLTQILLTFILIAGFVVVIGVIGYAIASRMLIIPILQMAEVATRISEGDLQQTIEVRSEDEIGVLETALSRILVASGAIAARLKQACEQIKIVSDEMLSMSEEQSSVSQKQSASIHHISGTIAEIAQSSKSIAENSDSVAKIAEATLQATRRVEETVKNTITGMQDIKEQVEKNTERIGYLGENISQIGNVVKIINTIADQTKIIAFNASIEAAGSGETGGRFSVVATEVRRLADTVVESLEEIKESVSSIQTAASELILSSETGIRKVNQGSVLITETGNTLQLIMEMLDKTTQSAKEISVSTQQQQQEHGRIVKDIKAIADGSEQSVEIGKRTTEIAKELRKLANELDAAVQNFMT